MPPVAWPYRANGADTIIERYGYRTDVLRSINGNEQRIQMRMQPVGGVEFTSSLRDADLVSAQRLLERNQAAEWAAPLWQYTTTLAHALLGLGESTVFCDLQSTPLGLEFNYLPFQDATHRFLPFYIWRSPDEYLLLTCQGQSVSPADTFVDVFWSVFEKPEYVQLAYQPVTNVTIRSYPGGVPYVEGVDYILNGETGTIFVPLTSSMPDHTYFKFDATLIEAATLETSETITQPFPAGSLVVPARLGRLENSLATTRPGRDVARQPLRFRFDGVDLSGFSDEPGAVFTDPAQHDGFDVLEQNNARDPGMGDAIDRDFDTLDGQIGALMTEDHVLAPSRLMDFHWICKDRPSAALLREFVDLRHGRAVPVWVPSFSQDLQLDGAYGAGTSTFTLKDGDAYRTTLFPDSGSRRHLQFRAPDGTRRWRKVASCSGATITVDSPVDIALPAGSLVSFIRLCRLEDDEIEIVWHPTRVSESRFQLREIPTEAPL